MIDAEFQFVSVPTILCLSPHITYRGQDWKSDEIKPCHWAFFLHTGDKLDPKSPGIVHQLRGMPGGFYYRGPKTASLNRSTACKQTLEIGEVSESKLEKVTELLRIVDIFKDKISAWNCQDWSLDALVKLQTEGFVDEQYSREDVKVWLCEQ